MTITNDYSLQALNTFGIAARAEYFAQSTSLTDLSAFVREAQSREWPLFVLGGGSNVLFTRDVPGLTLHVGLRGIETVREDDRYTWLKTMAGEVWHHLVLHALEQGLGGIENLSLIPGYCGAAPMQNIGAYGVELQEVFEELEALELDTGRMRTFRLADCHFGYRDSYFKQEGKGRYIITSLTLRLTRQRHNINTTYGAIAETLTAMGVDESGIREVSEAVVRIRQSKLPDPKELGNAGSFFKNPELSTAQFEALKTANPDIPHYLLPDGRVKVPAAWLIEQCGWKGKRIGNTGAHARQPLVLVNYGGATGEEMWHLAQDIRDSVVQRFGVELQPEVNVI
jgi:UDP-N-acetylmuramate dehydrogenase